VTRIGLGYDIHRLEEGRKLLLGGVEIPSGKGSLGHSDGDALIHAIIDAILGACSLGDIGQHFPDSDPALEGASSLELLSRIQERIQKMGRIEYLDTTVVLEKPALAPHMDSMREAIARTLKVPMEKISIKAKTAEGLGPVGEGRAVEAYAVALVDL
jgi:2-C-methyl-D-erythritol 2,4-cyclodiphosphate synthase